MHSIARATALAVALATPLFAVPATAGASHSLFEHVSDADPTRAGNGAFDATFHHASADGSRALFATSEQLAGGDSDNSTDIYERTRGVTTLVSRGEVNGNGAFSATFRGASADGSRIFFQTSERLVSADTDNSTDVYERTQGVTTLVSGGEVNGNGAFSAIFRGASADGSRIFFETIEQLVAADTDAGTDVYQRSGGATELVSAGATGGNGAFDAFFAGVSADGSRVFLESNERLTSADTDGSTDVYERSGGATTLVSAGATGGNGAFDALFESASPNGARVFFRTNERLVGADTDLSQDIYERSSGVTKRISAGAINGNGAFAAAFRGASANGSRVFFTTNEPLASADTDLSQDIYERSTAGTTLISSGAINGNGAFAASFAGASADGSHVFFTTNEPLTGQDNDGGARDVYRRLNGSTSLLSAGSSASNADFRAASADGRRVFFVTAESLVAPDGDGRLDLYEADRAQLDELTRISPGNGAFHADLGGVSSNGAAVFFTTREKVIVTDGDGATDIYGAFALQ